MTRLRDRFIGFLGGVSRGTHTELYNNWHRSRHEISVLKRENDRLHRLLEEKRISTISTLVDLYVGDDRNYGGGPDDAV